MRDLWSAHGTSTNPLYRKTSCFPPQEACGEATGITPWSARSIIWPMYARPIRISRGVIPAVRSCSYFLTAGSETINGNGIAEKDVLPEDSTPWAKELPSPTSHSNRSPRTEVSVAGKRNFHARDKEAETAL